MAINQAIDKIKFSATCWQKEPHQNRKRAVNPREAGVNPFTPVFFSFVRPGVSPNRASNKILARYNCAGHQINSGPHLLWHNTKMTKWFCGAEFIPGWGIFSLFRPLFDVVSYSGACGSRYFQPGPAVPSGSRPIAEYQVKNKYLWK